MEVKPINKLSANWFYFYTPIEKYVINDLFYLIPLSKEATFHKKY